MPKVRKIPLTFSVVSPSFSLKSFVECNSCSEAGKIFSKKMTKHFYRKYEGLLLLFTMGISGIFLFCGLWTRNSRWSENFKINLDASIYLPCLNKSHTLRSKEDAGSFSKILQFIFFIHSSNISKYLRYLCVYFYLFPKRYYVLFLFISSNTFLELSRRNQMFVFSFGMIMAKI